MTKKQLILVLVALLAIGGTTAGGVVYFLGGPNSPPGGTVAQLAKDKKMVKHAGDTLNKANKAGAKLSDSASSSVAMAGDKAKLDSTSAMVDSTMSKNKSASPALALSARSTPVDTLQLRADGLVKILNTMDAKHVAAAVELLSDLELREILGRLNNRQAAAVMTALPTDRVANLTRLVMGSQGGPVNKAQVGTPAAPVADKIANKVADKTVGVDKNKQTTGGAQ